jgi:hypothetical protein
MLNNDLLSLHWTCKDIAILRNWRRSNLNIFITSEKANFFLNLFNPPKIKYDFLFEMTLVPL